MERILVFAGAGASKAVNSSKYPTTVEFFDSLPQEIRQDGYFKMILEFIRKDLGSEARIDVEVLLWRLGELLSTLEKFGNTDELLGWFLDGGRLIKPLGKDLDLAAFHQIAEKATPRVADLVSSINTRVYDLYVRQPEERELAANWLPLLKALKRNEAPVELFTTNYDLVLETALDRLSGRLVDTGWRGNVIRSLEMPLWTDPGENARDIGLLTKLHGSVNWTRGDREGQIFVSDPVFKGHDRAAIVYPGFKGSPTSEPFKAFHQHFERVLQRTDIAVFIGFAFRDEHINDLCNRFLLRQAQVIIMNPSKVDHPFSCDSIMEMLRPFDLEGTQKLVELLSNRS